MVEFLVFRLMAVLQKRLDVFVHPFPSGVDKILHLGYGFFMAFRIPVVRAQRPVVLERISPNLKISLNGRAEIFHHIVYVPVQIFLAE